MPDNNQTIEYKQLLDNGEPFYPMVGKSSYSEWLGYEEVDGTPPDENFVLGVSNGGTGADNADDARANLGLNSACIVQKFSKAYQLATGATTTFSADFITTPSGYTLIGAVGWSANTVHVVAVSVRPMQNNQYSFELRNVGTSAANTTFDVWILFVKSEFVG